MGQPSGWVTALLGRCHFPEPGSSLDCAVSGGPDSLALLYLGVHAGCRATAYHVDHGLREGSEAEAELVAEVAAQLGADFRSKRVSVAPGPNLEARAREARFAVLPPGVATGHTADDQAETMLLNLLRGAGLDGLAAMRPGRSHPLLELRRFETEHLCERAGLRALQDPTNLDSRHLRNRVRHELLPLMSEIAGRDVAALLARQARLIAEDRELLDSEATSLDVTDAAALSAAPLPLARRAVRRWLRSAGAPEASVAPGCGPGSGGYPPSLAEVERVLAVARKEARACEVAGGARVERSSGRLRIRSARAPGTSGPADGSAPPGGDEPAAEASTDLRARYGRGT